MIVIEGGCGQACRFRRLAFAQALAGELDPVGVVHDPIEHGVGERRDADDVVPAVDRHLAGDQERAGVVAVLDDLQEIARLLREKRLGSPIVEHEQVDPGELAQELAVAPVAAGERQGREQARHAVVEDGQILPAGLVAERAGEPAFADPAWPGDQEVAPGRGSSRRQRA